MLFPYIRFISHKAQKLRMQLGPSHEAILILNCTIFSDNCISECSIFLKYINTLPVVIDFRLYNNVFIPHTVYYLFLIEQVIQEGRITWFNRMREGQSSIKDEFPSNFHF